MTLDRDLDPTIRAWFDLVPDEVPDRVVDAVLEAVEQTPQTRRALLRGPRRSTRMSRFLLIAAVAVLGIALLGGAALMAGGRPPTPAPSAVTAPSAAPVESPPVASATPEAGASLPDAFLYRWIGEPRPIGTVAASTRTGLNFGRLPSSTTGDDPLFYITGDDYPLFDFMLANVSLTPDKKLRFETRAENRTCAVGAVGTYAWTMSSPGGSILTIEPAKEDCPEREAAVTGTWYRAECTTVTNWSPATRNPPCWGDLDPGTYPTNYIDPRVGDGESWAPRFGAMTYTVPTGWANYWDSASALGLTPSADYATHTPDGPPPGKLHEIGVITHLNASDQAQACSSQADASVPPTVDGLIGFLPKVDGLDVTEPVEVTIGGYPGKMVDLRLASGWAGRCTGQTQPSLEFFTATDSANFVRVGLTLVGAERIRLILLDLGGGDVVAFLFDSSDPSRFDELVADGMPIVQSFTFR
jgi:hypothetical protein